MVDRALLETLRQLDFAALVEVRDEIDRLIDDEQVPEGIRAIVETRMARKGPGSDPEAVPADEFIRRIRARRSA